MNKSNKQRLIILSDIWGKGKSDWSTYYTSILEDYYEVKYYDSCVLGDIDKSEYSEEKLHNQFVDGGITKAVKNMLKEEKENSIVLGFSIGGYIAWKACNSGLKTQRLIVISSTRLRFETQKPLDAIELIYGEEDANKPDNNWFRKLGLKAKIYKNEDHELYKKKEIAEKICKMIIKQ
ncbi:MAG TPA: alpha/beta hydrolase [Lutibacter sp.]